MDPLGAIVGVVVFASLAATNGRSEFSIEQFLLSVTVGVASGLVFALLLMPILRTHRFSGRDKVAATLMMVVAAFLVANLAYDDSGLAAALVMGIVLINQSRVNITYIDEFKETLIPILLGILFVLLAANIDIGDVIALGLPGLAFVVFLAFVVRPLAVLTTIGLPLTWKERFLMMTFSARGVVAAATAPVFGVALVDKAIKGADEIVPVVFLVIAGTVLLSAILSSLVAKRLGMIGKSGPSIFLIGAPQCAIALGKTLGSVGTDVKFWTVESAQIERVKEAGLDLDTKPINPRNPEGVIGLTGVSLVAIATPNDTLNQVFAYELSESLEPDQVYRVPGPKNALKVVEDAGRLITTDVGMDEIEARVAGGDEFVVLGSGSELPDGAVPFLVLETTKTLSRPEVFFFCDRPESPRKRVRQVVALIPAAESPSV